MAGYPYGTGGASAVVPPPADAARYAYLVQRLRSRQITMEEATELFGIQQGMIRAAYRTGPPAMAPPMVRPPPAPEASAAEGDRGPAPTGGSNAGSPPGLTDDNLLLGILALGAVSGLLAAVLKRGVGPKAASPPPRTKPTS